MTTGSGFKNWLRLTELKDRKQNYFNAMKDLGIPPEVFKDMPVTFAQGQMGPDGVRDMGVYVLDSDPEERKDGSYQAKVRNVDDQPANKTQKRYRKYKGKWVLLPRDKNDEYPDDDRDYPVTDKELDGIFTQFLQKGGATATGLPGQGMGGL